MKPAMRIPVLLACVLILASVAPAGAQDTPASANTSANEATQDTSASTNINADEATPSDIPTAPRPPGVPDPAPPHPELRDIFERDFGGMDGMTALMDDFMAIMLDDPRLAPFFATTDNVRIKRQLAEQFCAILGGGCVYTGRDMRTSHALFAIDRADFNALVEALQIAMDRRGIPFRSQNKLLAILAPMHREVINR